MMNRYQELSFALGGGAVVARLGDIAVDWRGRIAGTAGRLFLDFVAADGIFPLSWQGGVIRECAFMTEFVRGDAAYCYLQLHTCSCTCWSRAGSTPSRTMCTAGTANA